MRVQHTVESAIEGDERVIIDRRQKGNEPTVELQFDTARNGTKKQE